ncbi:MAG: hypothetical protein AABM42_03080 [Actinomycetota bacterium]
MSSGRRTKSGKPTGGGGAGHPKSLANLNRGATPRSPAPAGNQRHRRHGGYARVVGDRLDAKVRELVEAIGEDLPLRDAEGDPPAADAAAVQLLVECLVRLQDVRGWLTDFGWRDEETGAPRQDVIELERRLRREAWDYLNGLGLTPAGRARLGLDLARTAAAIDPVAALSEPDPELRRALLQRIGLIPGREDDDGDD